MNPTAFDEENCVLSKPDDMTADECECLSCWKGTADSGHPVIISCWKPTAEEWEEMKKTGRIWIVIYGTSMPPIGPTGHKPFRVVGQ